MTSSQPSPPPSSRPWVQPFSQRTVLDASALRAVVPALSSAEMRAVASTDFGDVFVYTGGGSRLSPSLGQGCGYPLFSLEMEHNIVGRDSGRHWHCGLA
mmetsp:Transcript_43739/g.74681  ORF Transcript_43739/g.74681 Transcript_43739/m.74681 type:complete len:99 (+) Transcript_43739:1792-2088(+)